MKNVLDSEKKTCIFKTIDDFKRDVRTASNGDINVTTELDGISFNDITKNDFADNINDIMADYYDVKEITSIHIDDCDYTGVWICYKE